MSDLTPQEQGCVRLTLRYLHRRYEDWDRLAKAVHSTPKTLTNVVHGHAASASLAVRLARLAGVSVDDVLSGKYPPPGTCKRCGHREETASDGPTGEAAR